MRTNHSIHLYNNLEKQIEGFLFQIEAGYGKGNAIAGVAECLAEVLENDDLLWLKMVIEKEIEKNRA